jgi:Transmembrane adaptor Erv26
VVRATLSYYFQCIQPECLRVLPCLVLVLLNHYFWFRHFSAIPRVPPRSRYDHIDFPTFTEIASYFGLCVWLVPFALFVSLSASDNVLPTMGSEEPGGMPGGSGERKNKRQGMAKAVVDRFRDWVGDTGNVMGWWRTDRGTGF